MLSEGDLALVVQKVDKAIHWINLPPPPPHVVIYPVDIVAHAILRLNNRGLEVRRQEKPGKSSDFSFLFLHILADLISFLEIQRLQLAGSSSTVFAVNLIQGKAPWERG